MNGTAKTPAANHLLNVNDRAIKLQKDKADFFHYIVAKLLYLCRRTQQDIQTDVAFLCTRVKIQMRMTIKSSQGYTIC